MNLKKAAELYKNPNSLWDNLLFNRLMNKPSVQQIFIENEISYRKENDIKKILNKGYLSMKNEDTSIVLADTQVLEKCISMLNTIEDLEENKKIKEDIIELLEMEIKDIEGLEKELQSEETPSEIQVDKIIIGS